MSTVQQLSVGQTQRNRSQSMRIPSTVQKRERSVSTNSSRLSITSEDDLEGKRKSMMKNQFARPRWVHDSEAQDCFCCSAPFSLMKRKHHCRACGQIVCAKCSQHIMALSHLGYLDPQRVCDHCAPFTKPRKRTLSENGYYNAQSAPVRRSESILFSPPASPHVLDSSCDENEQDVIIADNTLYYYDFDLVYEKKEYPGIQVSVSNDRILVTAGSIPPFRAVFYRDILAIHKSEKNEGLLFIYWFPWVGKDAKVRKERRLVTKHNSNNERNKFYHTLYNFIAQSHSSLTMDQLKVRESKKLLVLINPKAGNGNAWAIFSSVKRIFDIAKIRVDPYCLDNTKHAAEIISQSDLSPYFAVACCGGDGLMHFVIDTIIRNDLKIPAFCIPAGHGIGLAASILANASPIESAYSIAKGFRRNLDLIEVKQNENLLCNGCLLVAWGLVANVEFDTAHLRWMGTIRYQLGAIAAITNPPLLHMRITYLPAEDQTMKFCTGEGCRYCKKGYLKAAADAEGVSSESIPHKVAQRIKVEEDGRDDDLLDGLQKDESEEESEWVVEEGQFIMVTCLNLSDTTINHRIAPYAHASDGCMDLVFIKDISRAGFLELYKTLKTGSFVDTSNFYLHEKLGYIKVKAAKIELLGNQSKSLFSVDGVQYEQTSPVELKVLPSGVVLGS